MRRYWRIGREWLLPTARFNNDGTENDLDADFLLQEDGYRLLQEDGSRIELEAGNA